MWTRYTVLSLLLGVIDGIVVSATIRGLALGRQRRNLVDSLDLTAEGGPRVLPERVAVSVDGGQSTRTHCQSSAGTPGLPSGHASDLPVGVLTTTGRPEAKVTGFDLVVGLVALGLIWFASATFLVVIGIFDLFGAINLLYGAVVVGLPVASLMTLTRCRPRGSRGRTSPSRSTASSKPAWVLLVGALLLAPFGFYASFVEPDRLELEVVDRVAVSPSRAGTSLLRVGVISDIQTRHIGPHELASVELLMSQRPDLILIAGDVFQSPPDYFVELPAIRSLLGRLDAPGGVYLVQGDSDPPLSLEPMVEGTQVRILRDQVARAQVRDRSVTIGGIDVDFRSPAATRVLEELQNTPGADDVRLLLSHRPDAVLRLSPSTRVDLVVSGHTHGGQVALPVIGPMLTLSAVPRRVGAGGLHELDGRLLFVSKGVGLERGQAPQVRFNVVPSVALVQLG